MSNINRDFTDKNEHDINKYSLTKADTKINNKHKLSKIRQSYQDDNVLNLQQLNTQKRLKIKAVQNIFTAEVKVNERNTWLNKDELKSFLHSNSLIRIIKDSYNCKQENINKIIQFQHVHIKVKSLLKW